MAKELAIVGTLVGAPLAPSRLVRATYANGATAQMDTRFRDRLAYGLQVG